MKLLKAGFCLAVLALTLSAQDEMDFQKWMKTVGGQMGTLRKMEMKTGPEAVASAEKLSATFAQVGTYFTTKNADDAVKMAGDAKAASDDLLAAAKAGDNDKATAAFKTIGGSCKGCHDVHREKVGDAYKIK